MKRMAFHVVSWGFASLVTLGPAFASATPCLEERSLTARDYWFWSAYLGVQDEKDTGPDRIGRLTHDPSICFHVPRSELDDPIARTRGLRRAVHEWLGRIAPRPEPWGKDAEAKDILTHLHTLTGRAFRSQAELTAWWVSSHEYLRWSKALGRLEVDRAARSAKSPVAPEFETLTPQTYWYHLARGELEDVAPDGPRIQGRFWTLHGHRRFQIERAMLDAPEARTEGYTAAVESFLTVMALDETDPTSKQEAKDTLHRLTGERFENAAEGWRWWSSHAENRARLAARLSSFSPHPAKDESRVGQPIR